MELTACKLRLTFINVKKWTKYDGLVVLELTK